MRTIGIDLAWGKKNTSGVVCLEYGGNSWRPIGFARSLLSDEEIVDFVSRFQSDKGCIVAIDAPTVVRNLTGQRECEQQCKAIYSKYQASPYPANRTIFHDDVRGERIVLMLEGLGFIHDPCPPKIGDHHIMEVFPHPAHIELFGLQQILKYKAKSNRSVEFRLSEYARYVEYLLALLTADPALNGLEELLSMPSNITHKTLKEYEDGLDALTCAYVAAYYVRWGSERIQVFGDNVSGHIVVPAVQFRN